MTNNTKTLEERIAEIKLIANHAASRNQDDHAFGLDQGRRIMANQAMSIISELQQLLHLKDMDLTAAQGIIVEMKGESEKMKKQRDQFQEALEYSNPRHPLLN